MLSRIFFTLSFCLYLNKIQIMWFNLSSLFVLTSIDSKLSKTLTQGNLQENTIYTNTLATF